MSIVLTANSGINPWNTVTNGCLVTCEAGDYLWVSAYGNDTAIYGDPSVPYTTFTVLHVAEGNPYIYVHWLN